MRTKRGFILLILPFLFFILFIIPLASAETIVNKQPDSVYNLGDVATLQITFKPVQAVSGNFQMDLLCGANSINFYKNGLSVSGGEEKVIESSLVLMNEIINNSLGTCKVKAYLGNDYVLTNEFLISDLITIESNLSRTEFNPGENILVKGNALKENGRSANGFIELGLLDGNLSVASQKATINNGAFSANITIPKDAKSGNYLLRIFAYEEDISGAITNNGVLEKTIFIKQVPTSLEIIFEKPGEGIEAEFEPGTTIMVKAVLHDQSGASIASTTFLTIKNSKNKIIEQTEVSTDEFIEFLLSVNEQPSQWTVVAVSNRLTVEAKFTILEKESATIEIVNKTVLITNTGNIPYNKTVLVKIGNQSLNIDVYLKVDESQRWLLTAPDGEYDVSVIAEDNSVSSSVALTGSAIEIRKASAGVGSLVKFPAVWIFIIAVLGLMTFIVFKRGYQKAFIGYITRGIQKSAEKNRELEVLGSSTKNKAEMVLSIKGDKQEVSIITLKIKNMAWVKNTKEGSASEALEKIIGLAENLKAVTYEAGDNVFFIFAPARTKTFKNESAALKVAQKINDMLNHHNKMFNQKVDFGISLNVGEIIAKQDSDSFKFMGLGSLMASSKKIASLANNDVLMGEKITDRLKTMVKTEKHKHDGIDTYSIKEVKDTEKHEKFLKGFMKRHWGDKD